MIFIVIGFGLALLAIFGAFSPIFIIGKHPLGGTIMLFLSAAWGFMIYFYLSSGTWTGEVNGLSIVFAVLSNYLIAQVFIVQGLRNEDKDVH